MHNNEGPLRASSWMDVTRERVSRQKTPLLMLCLAGLFLGYEIASMFRSALALEAGWALFHAILTGIWAWIARTWVLIWKRREEEHEQMQRAAASLNRAAGQMSPPPSTRPTPTLRNFRR